MPLTNQTVHARSGTVGMEDPGRLQDTSSSFHDTVLRRQSRPAGPLAHGHRAEIDRMIPEVSEQITRHLLEEAQIGRCHLTTPSVGVRMDGIPDGGMSPLGPEQFPPEPVWLTHRRFVGLAEETADRPQHMFRMGRELFVPDLDVPT